MSQATAVVTIAKEQGRDTVESERAVRSLEELYRACREAPPSRLVRVVIQGSEGAVRLDFASFTPRR